MIFFFYGSNTYAAKRQMAALIDKFRAKAGNDLGLERWDGEKVNAASLVSDLQSVPFLANSRLVIIDRLGRNKPASEALASHVAGIPESTVLVLFEPEADQRTTYFKTMSKAGQAVKFDPLSPVQLAAWVRREAERLNAQIGTLAVRKLLDYAGDDQWRLEQEISKLAAYSSTITADMVELLVEPSASASVFALTDALTSGNVAAALTVCEDLLAQRQNEVYLVSMIIWQLRNLLLAKTAGNLPSAELARTAKLSPYVAGKAQQAARGVSLEWLKSAFIAATDADLAIKTGVAEPAVIVERLVYQLASRS